MIEPRKPLTNMQQVVAECLARKATYAATSKELGLSESTVRTHVQAIARLLPNPDALAPSKVVFLWAAQVRWEKERVK